MNKDVANLYPFLSRFEATKPTLLTASVSKYWVLAVKLERLEEEIITFVADVRINAPASENEGVAFVVPAKKITDILNSPGLKYWASSSLAQYLQQQKDDADAYDLGIATLKLPSPPPEYKWCQTSVYLSAKALAPTLKKPLSEIPPTDAPERVPFLPWRANVKSAVTLLPAGRLEPTDADKYLLYGMDDSYFYVLKLDDNDPRGSASTVPRQGYTLTYIR